jgi:hypothetical protein
MNPGNQTQSDNASSLRRMSLLGKSPARSSGCLSHYPSANGHELESPRDLSGSGGGHWDLPSRTGPQGTRFRTAPRFDQFSEAGRTAGPKA